MHLSAAVLWACFTLISQAEPVVVDLLSDDDADLPPEALAAGSSGDAAAAGARPASGSRSRAVRTTRAKQYMSTSDRFKVWCWVARGRWVE
jgi:hypothetical protein